MRSDRGQGTTPQHQNINQQRPDIRDNLDSRKNEEQQTKGDDVTHNQKAHREPQQKKKKED